MVHFGGAGHSEEIVKRLSGKGLLIGIDRDEEALRAAKQKLEKYKNVKYVHGNHDEIRTILFDLGIEQVDGILLDLGVSSYQLDERSRGFSYMGNAKLDMRMDKNQELTAEKVVNEYSEEKLADIIYKYGEERFSKSIARNICERRKEKVKRGFYHGQIVCIYGEKCIGKRYALRGTVGALPGDSCSDSLYDQADTRGRNGWRSVLFCLRR